MSNIFKDGGNEHGKGHQHQQLQEHHLRQRRQEPSPSQAIYQKEGNFVDLSSQITFGHETMATSEWVFLTKNESTVRAHIGSTALLPCDVIQGSQFGTVRILHLKKEKKNLPSHFSRQFILMSSSPVDRLYHTPCFQENILTVFNQLSLKVQKQMISHLKALIISL